MGEGMVVHPQRYCPDLQRPAKLMENIAGPAKQAATEYKLLKFYDIYKPLIINI